VNESAQTENTLRKKYAIYLQNHVSIEITTKCSFVIEFIIPMFIEVSTSFERHTAKATAGHHMGI
jgi:hypothetical protein